MAVSDRIAVMNLGQIQQVGTPQAIYQRPANLFVASFIGRTNILKGRIRLRGGEPLLDISGETTLPVGATLRPDAAREQSVVVSVRPEEFYITQGVGIPATVNSRTFLGLNMQYFLTLDTGEQVQVIQEAELDAFLEEGARVNLGVKLGKINVFSEDGAQSLMTGVVNDAL